AQSDRRGDRRLARRHQEAPTRAAVVPNTLRSRDGPVRIEAPGPRAATGVPATLTVTANRVALVAHPPVLMWAYRTRWWASRQGPAAGTLGAAGLGDGGRRAAGLDDGADLLGGHAALEHVAFKFEVKLGQANLPPAHVEADAHDPDQGDKGDLGAGHEPGVGGEDLEHGPVSHG